MKKEMLFTCIMLYCIAVFSSCDKTNTPGEQGSDSSAPPSTIYTKLFKTLEGYIGMNKNQITTEMSKLEGADSYSEDDVYGYLTFKKKDYYKYIIRLEMDKVTEVHLSISGLQATSGFISCSEAFGTLGGLEGTYSAMFVNYINSETTNFTNHNAFFSYLNANKNSLSYHAAEGIKRDNLYIYWFREHGDPTDSYIQIEISQED